MRNEEAKQKTTSALLKIARKHFTWYGYYDASLEKIAEEGNVTRGAVYHHFKNKKGLFLAVLDKVQADVAIQIESEAMNSDDPWQQLILGCSGFIKAANEKECRRILLADAPVVIGWDRWRKADRENSMVVLCSHIEELGEQGYLDEAVDPALMTYTVSGALNELALHYSDYETDYDSQKLEAVIAQLVSGFRKK